MVEHVKIFMDEDIFFELEDTYLGKEAELRKAVQGFVKNLFVQTKVAQMTKSLVCNVEVEGDIGTRHIEERQIPFSEIDFTRYKNNHDPNWLPKVRDGIKLKPYVLAVGDITWKKLLEFAIHFQARVDKYNESLIINPEDLAAYKKDRSLPKGLSQKQIDRFADFPQCFEHILQIHLADPVINLVTAQASKTCDEEFAELEKQEAEKEKKSG